MNTLLSFPPLKGLCASLCAFGVLLASAVAHAAPGDITELEPYPVKLEPVVAPYGLDAPEPVAPFLDGVFPSQTPQSPDSSEWQVVDAFQVSVPNTLVIEPNPSDNRMYVGSRGGVIVSLENDESSTEAPKPFMDLSDRVAVVWDGGFLGLAFHPEFGMPGSAFETTFYAYYSSYCPTKQEGARYVVDFDSCNPGYPQSSTGGFFNTWLRLSRFEAYWDEALGVWRGEPSSELPLFNIRLYNGSHRGSGPAFGPDGRLYVAIGDQFRYETAQDIVGNFEGGSMRFEVEAIDHGDGTWSCPLGSHLPIRTMQDVTGNADEMTGHQYCVPDDNPWPGWSGENFGEYNSIGHRNPHRLALDPVTGLFWSGEVGQNTREEINVIMTGRNYQWPYMEGYAPGVRSRPAVVIGQEQPPVIDFDRSEARTVIGGYVYRGSRFPELSGTYIAGDFSTDKIWAISLDMNTMTASKQFLTVFPSGALATFGQDNAGEIFMGDVFADIPLQRLDRIGEPVPDPPALLSQTGAFLDTANFVLNPAAVPFDPVPFWSDGAYKQRWLFLPNDGVHDTPEEQIAFSADSNWGFPVGTVAMKHFELGLDESDPSVRTRLETRFLVQGEDGQVYGVTYRWLPDQSDAELLTVAETDEYTIERADGSTRQQTWLFPSRFECLQCHTDAAGGFLGPRTHLLNQSLNYPSTGRTDNQLRTWNHLGMFTPPFTGADISGFPKAARLDDLSASLEVRVRSWLDSNCSYCHRPETGNRAAFDARFTTPLMSQGLVWGSVLDDLGLSEPYLVYPGVPESSVLRHRVAAAGTSTIKMPPLAKELADQDALALLDAWILRVDPGYPRSGVEYEYYEVTGLSALPNFDALTPATTGTASTFDISERRRDDHFAFRFRAYLDVPETGSWTFYTSSDDGSQLFIDGGLVVDNDGLHGDQEASGTVELSAGYHEVVVTMFEREGGEVLRVQWQGPQQPKAFISPAALYQERPAVVVNQQPTLSSPGPQISDEGGSVWLNVQASDSEGDLLHFEAKGLPAGLSIDSISGQIGGTVAPGQLGVHRVTVGVSDGPGAAAVTFDWTIVPPNEAPLLTNPGAQSNAVGETVFLVIEALDPEDQVISFDAVGLPAGLSIDPSSGEISGTLSLASAGRHSVTVTATDGIEDTSIAFEWRVLASIPAEAGYVASVGNTGWTTVVLERSYDSMVVLATPKYGQNAPPMVTRVRNASGNSFELKVQRMDGSLAEAVAGVHYFVVEEGVYDEARYGVSMEAAKYLSSVTDSDASWLGEPQVYGNSYAAPVVLGQVMSANDPEPSSFWARGSAVTAPPSAAALYTGKTVSEDPIEGRADELIGYVVIESGSGTLAERRYEAGLGADTVEGLGSSPPYLYALGSLWSADVAVLSMAAMDGYNGGWPVLMGNDPFGTFIELAVDEDQLLDGERAHTTEQVAYLVFEGASQGGNMAPQIVPLADQLGIEGEAFRLQIDARDPDGDVLSYSAQGLPAGLTLDAASGLVGGTPAASSAGSYDVQVTADDGTASVSTSFRLTVTRPSTNVRAAKGIVRAVRSDAWTTVTLPEAFDSMVVVTTPVYVRGDAPAVVRVRNAVGNSFELRMARFDSGTEPLSVDVHYLAVEEGVYTSAEHGIQLEAVKYLSTVTDGAGSWTGEPRSYANSYVNPVVLGQVMSANDPSPSSFWCHGPLMTTPPSAEALRTGKSVSEDPNRNRADETVGYIVVEAGLGSLAGTQFVAALGADLIRGIDDAVSPVSYVVSGLSSASVALANVAGLDGINGGWAVLYGAPDPSGSALRLVVDEDQLLDAERAHTDEQLGYVIFEQAQTSPAPGGGAVAQKPLPVE